MQPMHRCGCGDTTRHNRCSCRCRCSLAITVAAEGSGRRTRRGPTVSPERVSGCALPRSANKVRCACAWAFAASLFGTVLHCVRGSPIDLRAAWIKRGGLASERAVERAVERASWTDGQSRALQLEIRGRWRSEAGAAIELRRHCVVDLGYLDLGALSRTTTSSFVCASSWSEQDAAAMAVFCCKRHLPPQWIFLAKGDLQVGLRGGCYHVAPKDCSRMSCTGLYRQRCPRCRLASEARGVATSRHPPSISVRLCSANPPNFISPRCAASQPVSQSASAQSLLSPPRLRSLGSSGGNTSCNACVVRGA